jgi:hypothetical protein
MTKARYKDKLFGISERVNIATSDVRGLVHKEELEYELNRMKIDICIITETKIKLKGTIL